MRPVLELLTADGAPVSLDAASPVDLGDVHAGGASAPRAFQVRNAGDAAARFVRVRAGLHPSDQEGSLATTAAATEFAFSAKGGFGRELDLGHLRPGQTCPFWVRWTPPRGAPAGPVVWAIEVIAST